MKISSYSNRVGGFASVNTGTIRNCYTDAKLKYKYQAAGFVFENLGKIEYAVAQKYVKGKENIGGFYCKNKGEIANSGWLSLAGSKKRKNYVDAEMALEGESVFEIFERLQFGDEWVTPEKRDERFELAEKLKDLQEHILGKTPVEIRSADDLFRIAADIANGDSDAASAYYKLTSDINLRGKKWLPIGISELSPFTGVFDGAGHKIHNFKIQSKNLDYAGFFGYVKGGCVANLTLDCVVNAKGGSVTGSMCAVNDGGAFYKCRVIAKLSAEKSCGGFIGKNAGLIEGSCFIGAIGSVIPPILFWLPLLGLLLLLLIIGLVLLMLRMRQTPYGPEIIDPNQRPVQDEQPFTPPPAGSSRISFELNQNVYINVETQVGLINYVNPRRSTQDVVISILISDAELLRVIGKTGRTAEEQAALEADPNYDPEKSYQQLFRSGRLQIGYELEATKLGALSDGTFLPVGEYEMIVAIDAYDPETNEKAVVNAQAPIAVYIIESASAE